jgi:hydroxymethylbilane synthase
MKLRLGTSGTELARAQSQWAAQELLAAAAEQGIELDIEHVVLTHLADPSHLSPAGPHDPPAAVAQLREALLADCCDVLVHAVSDLPVEPRPGLTLAAFCARSDVGEALCAGGVTWEDLPDDARVGIGSARRAAQLLALRPGLTVEPLRGNVDAQLAAVGTQFDAVVLAVADVNSLGSSAEIDHVFPVDQMVPAAGQGALALELMEGAAEALWSVVTVLDDAKARACVTAERAALAVMGAGYSSPVGAYASLTGSAMTLVVKAVRADGKLSLMEKVSAPVGDAASLGRRAGHALLGRGAERLFTTA